MRLAVIPARGGSKRLPRKNVKSFCGKPMIAWSIKAAVSCGCFDKVIISTDNEEIAEVSREYGAEVPFVRPAEISDDHTPTIPVIRHAIEWATENWAAPEIICCLYATAPFVTPELLQCGLCQLEENPDTEFVFSASEFPTPFLRALKQNGSGMAEMFWPEYELTRSQDLPRCFQDAGQFYWGRREAFMTRDGFFNARSQMVELPLSRVQDIDEPEDWQRAEIQFLKLQEGRAS